MMYTGIGLDTLDAGTRALPASHKLEETISALGEEYV